MTIFSLRRHSRGLGLSPRRSRADSTAPSGDTEAPSVPQNLIATAVSSSQIDLTWDASTDNVAVTGYKIYRDNVLADDSPTNAYSDTGLASGTLYQYEVSAFDAAGNESARSAPDSATTHQAIVTAGLLAEWRFDDGAGQQVTDHSGNGHHATLGATGGVEASDPTWQASPAALSFDGGDQALTSSFAGPTAFEVDMLLFGDSSCQAFGMIFVPHADAGFDSQATTQIFRNGSNATLTYRVKGNTPGPNGTANVFNNAWHIVQAWSDGNNFAAAVDGVEDVAQEALGTPLTSSTGIVGIGARGNILGPSLGMTGKLAYLIYYSRALSPAERAQNYNALVAIAAARGITFP